MLLNKYIVIYALFLVCSLGAGLPASAYGLMVLLRRRKSDSVEKRHHLENYLYLSSSAMFIGALIRLMMIPLWFLMLKSLIPSIPGAMCLAGVHLNVPIYSWMASSMKLILPWLYFSWIFITIIDRRIAEQPFSNLRQIILIPVLLFLFGEAFFDIKFLTGLTPTPVTCCTAVFDFNTEGIPTVLTETHWYFVVVFLFALLIQLSSLFTTRAKRWIHITTAALSIILFISLVLALHTRLSPLILDSPFHHCIFCLLENNVVVLFGFALLLIAIYLSFAFGLTAFANYMALESLGHIRIIKFFNYALYAAGTAFIAIPTLIQLFTDSGGL